MAKHIHFVIQGYERETETGALQDVATIDVYADGTEEAMTRARALVTKKHYRVQSVIEHNPELESENAA